MPNVNEVTIAGNLTADPKLKFVGDAPCCHFSVAVNRKKGKGGQGGNEVTYVPVTAWGWYAEDAGERLFKGSPVVLKGRLRISQYQAKDGSKKTAVEVVAYWLFPLAKRPGQGGVEEGVPSYEEAKHREERAQQEEAQGTPESSEEAPAVEGEVLPSQDVPVAEEPMPELSGEEI